MIADLVGWVQQRETHFQLKNSPSTDYGEAEKIHCSISNSIN
jgi:hypothetical protein